MYAITVHRNGQKIRWTAVVVFVVRCPSPPTKPTKRFSQMGAPPLAHYPWNRASVTAAFPSEPDPPLGRGFTSSPFCSISARRGT